jgi:hypothetical protein
MVWVLQAMGESEKIYFPLTTKHLQLFIWARLPLWVVSYGFAQPLLVKYAVNALEWNTFICFHIHSSSFYINTPPILYPCKQYSSTCFKQGNNPSVAEGSVLLKKWSANANKIRSYRCLLEAAFVFVPVTYCHSNFGVQQMKLVISWGCYFSTRVSFSLCNNVPSVLFPACKFEQ